VHDSLESLHDRLKELRYKRAAFYERYYPRFDIVNGKKILFKERHMHDVGDYLAQKFYDKNSLKKWLTTNREEGKTWALQWLKDRKEAKGLVYAPSQAELRSLMCPSMPYYDFIGGYYKLTREMGFKDRYEDIAPVFAPLGDAIIIQDTREQNPLHLKHLVFEGKVDEGDYVLDSAHDQGVCIERKSLSDFCGTLSSRKIARKKGDDSSFARFDRELARATEKGRYVVMLVEENINHALGFEFLPHMKRVQASASHIFKNLRDLLTKYPLSFQVVFADGRIDAADKLVKILSMGAQVRKIDLQNALEKGLL
jgi:hypothetical protein